MGKLTKRPTIGVLYSWPIFTGTGPNLYVMAIIEGIRAAARDFDCNILLSCGLRYAGWPESGPGSDFVPVGPWNTDGLLILAPLSTTEKLQYIRLLKEANFPLMFIARESDDYPAVYADNAQGMRQVFDHLFLEHGHRKIAFIAGIESDQGDSFNRFEAYKRCMAGAGLELNPRLIAYGEHLENSGFRAMKQILDSGEQFTAVIASNDDSAIGAMAALHEAGRRIPEDVAVIGFDNILSSLAQIPPLATVHYSRYELGYQGLRQLLGVVEAGSEFAPLHPIVIPAVLVRRQSCGCLPDSPTILSHAQEERQAILNNHTRRQPSHTHPGEDLSLKYRPVVDEMVDVIIQSTGNMASADFINSMCNRLVCLFADTLQNGDALAFRARLRELTLELDLAEQNLDVWQQAISVLRRYKERLAPEDKLMEDLLHLCREIFSESVNRRLVRSIMQWNQEVQVTGELTLQFLGAHSEAQALESFFRHMDRVGIQKGWVGLYEPDKKNPFTHCRLWGMKDGKLAGQRIKSKNFPLREILPDDSGITLNILPLLQHEDEVMGFAALQTDHYRPLGIVAREFAVAIHSARLHEEVVDLSLTDSLTGVNNRRYLDIFLDQEVERCKRFNRHLSLLFLDVDRFKDINDQLGHLAGDEVMRWVAKQIRKSVRRGVDSVTRYGGDEFAVILPETDARGGLEVAERIRQAVTEKPVAGQTITVSIGVAAEQGNEAEAKMLIKRADIALYKAKENRNTICVFV